jgi:hypothetical protein
MQKNPAYENPAAATPPSHTSASEPMAAPTPASPPVAAPTLPTAPPAGSVPKYIKVNGVMQKNPAHPDNGAVSSKMAAPTNSLTPICTMNDIANQVTPVSPVA